MEVDDGEYKVETAVISSFASYCFLFANAVFTFIIYNLQTLSQKVLDLELRENQKYKYMFNTLQD